MPLPASTNYVGMLCQNRVNWHENISSSNFDMQGHIVSTSGVALTTISTNLSKGHNELAPMNALVGHSIHRMGCLFSFGF